MSCLAHLLAKRFIGSAARLACGASKSSCAKQRYMSSFAGASWLRRIHATQEQFAMRCTDIWTEPSVTGMGELASCAQLRAARALLGWTQRDLGKALGVDERQVRFWERRIPSNSLKRQKITLAFAEAGVEFISSPTVGVRLAGDA